MKRALLLVDLSSVLHPIFHMSGKEPNVDHCSQATVAKVYQLAYGYEFVAVCCDAGRCFRHDISSEYKANRPERDETLQHQMLLAKEQLVKDGFAVWTAPGFEADDIIATAVRHSAELDEPLPVVIASSDKDIMQLVDARVSQLTLTANSALYDPPAVRAKFGVEPSQMRDWLILVGDKSDNVAGVPGIGPKLAQGLLTKFGSLHALTRRLGEGYQKLGITLFQHTALAENVFGMEMARKLITLSDQAPIDFGEALKPRAAKAETEFKNAFEETHMDVIDEETGEVLDDAQQLPGPPAAEKAAAAAPAIAPDAARASQVDVKADSATAAAAANAAADLARTPPEASVRSVVTSALVTTSWNTELEPRSLGQAVHLSKMMHDSRLFVGAYGTPQAVLSTILAGRELGIGAMAALRGFHIIDGKPTMSAGLMHALVLQSGKAKYFTCTERTSERATFKTLRVGPDEQPISVTYTMEDARRAGLIKPGGGWEKNPADMLVARAIATLARLRYPDVCFGMYTAEEMGREELDEAA